MIVLMQNSLLSILIAAICAQSARTPDLGRLYAVVVTECQEGLDYSQSDREALVRWLKRAIPEDRLVVRELRGKEVTKVGLLKVLLDLPAGPQDAILCFFSGDGLVPKPGGDRMLSVVGNSDDGWILARDIRAASATHRPRLAVIIADCCATFGGAGLTVKPTPIPTRTVGQTSGKIGPPQKSVPDPGCNNLFFKARGQVELYAASEGSCAWSDDDGGLFTRSLIRELEDSRYDPEVDWGRVLLRVRRGTENVYRRWRMDVIRSRTPVGGDIWKAAGSQLLRQPTQSPQADELPGAPLGAVIEPALGAGVVVQDLTRFSPLAVSGVRVGETINSIDGKSVNSCQEFERLVKRSQAVKARAMILMVSSDRGVERIVAVPSAE